MAQQQLIGNEKASVFRGKLNDNFTELYDLVDGKVIIQGHKLTYALLESEVIASEHSGEYWIVDTSTGSSILFNRKEAGLYVSDGTTWNYSGIDIEYSLTDNNWFLADNGDSTKTMQFELDQLTTGNNVILTVPDYSGTLVVEDDLVASNIEYDNTDSELLATDVNTAINEIAQLAGDVSVIREIISTVSEEGNLYDRSTNSQDTRLDGETGQEEFREGWIVTDFIEVEKDKTIHAASNDGLTVRGMIFCYNENKDYLGRVFSGDDAIMHIPQESITYTPDFNGFIRLYIYQGTLGEYPSYEDSFVVSTKEISLKTYAFTNRGRIERVKQTIQNEPIIGTLLKSELSELVTPEYSKIGVDVNGIVLKGDNYLHTRSIVFTPNDGKSYKISIQDQHSRLRAVGSVIPNSLTWEEEYLIDDSINGNITFNITPLLANQVIVYVSNSEQEPAVSIEEYVLTIPSLKLNFNELHKRSFSSSKYIYYNNPSEKLDPILRKGISPYRMSLIDVTKDTDYKFTLVSELGSQFMVAGLEERITKAQLESLPNDYPLDEIFVDGWEDKLVINSRNCTQFIVYTSNEGEDVEFSVKEVGLFESILVESEKHNLFDGYIQNDRIIVGDMGFLARSTLGPDGQYKTAVIDIEPNTEYRLERLSFSDSWRVALMKEKVDLDTIPDSPDKINVDYSIVLDNVYSVTEFNSRDATQLFVYVSKTGQEPDLEITEIPNIEFTKKISLKSIPKIPKSHLAFDIDSANGNSNSSASYVFMDKVGDYDSPDLDGVSSTDSFFLGGSMVADVYPMWDALVDAHPEYITKTLLGYSQANELPIYEFHFNPERIDVSGNQFLPSDAPYAELPKILINANIHGEEKQSSWTALKFFEDLCNRWEADDTLKFLKNNFQYKVIPVLNPNGYNLNIRGNGVVADLNRQFKLPYEDLQSEGKIAYDWIEENNDAIFFVDMHTMWAGKDRNTAWILTPPQLDKFLIPMSNSVIRHLTGKWKGRYPVITYQGLMGYSGSASYANGGDDGDYGQIRMLPLRLGIPNSATLEIANHVNYSGEHLRYGKMTTNMYVDMLGNYLVAIALKFGATLK